MKTGQDRDAYGSHEAMSLTNVLEKVCMQVVSWARKTIKDAQKQHMLSAVGKSFETVM